MRLCVIGNSHIGALKRGEPTDFGGVTATYFGTGGDHLRGGVEVTGTGVRPTDADVRETFAFTSGGVAEVKFMAYDGFLLVGADFGIFAKSSFCEAVRVYPGDVKHRTQLVSLDFITQSVARLIESGY